jgi:hypothetical protein
MSTTQHLISTGSIACELGISVRMLRTALDQLGCQPTLVLNNVSYFPKSTVRDLEKILGEIDDQKRKPSPKKSAGAL